MGAPAARQRQGRFTKLATAAVLTTMLLLGCLIAHLALLPAPARAATAKLSANASATGDSSWEAEQLQLPSSSGGANFAINGVSCPTSDFCMASGEYDESASQIAMAFYEQWNGSNWSAVAAPPTPGYKGSGGIAAISCSSASFCVAVGNYAVTAGDGATVSENSLIEQWNGASWSVVAAPNPPHVSGGSIGDVGLDAVSCSSGFNCIAVGSYQGDGNEGFQPYIESLSSGQWTLAATPAVGNIAYLTSVSCVSSVTCFAAGAEETSTSGPQHAILLEDQGGSWSLGYTVDADPANASVIHGVSCASATQCVATGEYQIGSADFLLDVNWNGSSWAVSATPPTIGQANAVACSSATLCTMVGSDQIAAWNGSTWTSSTIPTEPAKPDFLSVSCAGTMCMAVGYSLSGSGILSEYLPSHNQVSVTLDPLKTTASGLEVVKATITDRSPNGDPVADQPIEISPPPGYDVPAIVCDSSNRLVYPQTLSDGSAIGTTFTRDTNSDGEIDLTIYPGTVGGSWLLTAGEPGAALSLSGHAELEIDRFGGGIQLPFELPALLVPASDKSIADYLRGGLGEVLDWLGKLKTRGGENATVLRNVGFAPIWARDPSGQIHVGVVLFAESPDVRQRVFDYIDGKTKDAPSELEAVVIDISNMRKFQLGTAFAGHPVNTVGYRFPSLKQWADGGKVDIGENNLHQERHIPILARGRPHFGFYDARGAENLSYEYGPYPEFRSDEELTNFNRCVSG